MRSLDNAISVLRATVCTLVPVKLNGSRVWFMERFMNQNGVLDTVFHSSSTQDTPYDKKLPRFIYPRTL